MNLVHILSSIGEFKSEKTREFIRFTRSLNVRASHKSLQPRYIVTDREVILFDFHQRPLDYRKHALLMTPLIMLFLALLLDVPSTDALMNNYQRNQTTYIYQQTLGANTASVSATFGDIDLHTANTPTPTPEIVQPFVTEAPTPQPTLIPTVAPVLQLARPSNFMDVYQSAGAKYGVPWQILYGVHLAETGLRDGPIMNYQGSGARGPMQFMPGTWRAYGVDGNGDGIADIDNAVDAIYGAANYLSRHGTIDQALTAYGTNKSRVYAAARSLGWNG